MDDGVQVVFRVMQPLQCVAAFARCMCKCLAGMCDGLKTPDFRAPVLTAPQRVIDLLACLL